MIDELNNACHKLYDYLTFDLLSVNYLYRK